ncbi:MAG: DUF2252 domain-containing protein [Deltaproteobacteria bacterium]|nr:DUF2252 domain-containing protein [Deltaproteobacteria bacterium]
MINVETEPQALAKERASPAPLPGGVTAEQLRAHGKALRRQVRRSSLGTGVDLARDPVKILRAQNAQRLPELIPVRMGRMAHSPFTFYRGAAAVMAHDLARTPVTGITVQACGDAHLSNFGFFASPELELIFDVNDFDETHPAPWEWDVERLMASLAIAALENGLSERRARDIVLGGAAYYREQMARMAGMTPLQRFHLLATAETLMQRLKEREKTDPTRKGVLKEVEKAVAKARRNTSEHALSKLSVADPTGSPRIVDQPPLLMHPKRLPDDAHDILRRYVASARPDVAALLAHYTTVDFAMKVVGVGSVGTRCYLALSMDRCSGEPMFLQLKEAVTSVLEPYTRRSAHRHQGQRVVTGQHLMQAATDPFLGWTTSEGRHFYVRQFRDMKGAFDIASLDFVCLQAYARLCGAVLARAHAQTGDPALISGYLGSGDTFDEAMGDFAMAYAKQNEADHQALLKAIKAGKVRAEKGV